MTDLLLVVNAGSSSLKLALFAASNQQLLVKKHIEWSEEKNLFTHLSEWITTLPQDRKIRAIGHRVVHGGRLFKHPVLIDDEVLHQLTAFDPLAPLHQPYHIEAIHLLKNYFPTTPQVACFDTSFHTTQRELAKLFAIPTELTAAGIIRYGFHGLSYEYIASVLPQYGVLTSQSRVIVAHLGSGASLCAMKEQKSVATSMGFSALDGLMMATRCGQIDPGVLLYLLEEKKYTLPQLQKLLYQESGLLGVSEISGDIRVLEQSASPKARLAIDLFCYRVALELSGLCMPIGGCDAIVFTAGIGEHAAEIRKKICAQLQFMGVMLDDRANEKNAQIISTQASRITVFVIPTDEAAMIAKHTSRLCQQTSS